MRFRSGNILVAFLFSLTVIIFSCNKPKTVIPAGVLTEKEMIPVLTDVHIAQAAATAFDPKDTSAYTMDELLDAILRNHHIERTVYDSSISFYTRHPELMKAMYDEVINELSKKQGEVTSK